MAQGLIKYCDGLGLPACSLPTRYLRGGACPSGAPEAMAPKAIKEGGLISLARSLSLPTPGDSGGATLNFCCLLMV